MVAVIFTTSVSSSFAHATLLLLYMMTREHSEGRISIPHVQCWVAISSRVSGTSTFYEMNSDHCSSLVACLLHSVFLINRVPLGPALGSAEALAASCTHTLLVEMGRLSLPTQPSSGDSTPLLGGWFYFPNSYPT